MNQSRAESFEDKHIIAKHETIYPTQEEVNIPAFKKKIHFNNSLTI